MGSGFVVLWDSCMNVGVCLHACMCFLCLFFDSFLQSFYLFCPILFPSFSSVFSCLCSNNRERKDVDLDGEVGRIWQKMGEKKQ